MNGPSGHSMSCREFVRSLNSCDTTGRVFRDSLHGYDRKGKGFRDALLGNGRTDCEGYIYQTKGVHMTRTTNHKAELKTTR